MLRPYLSAMTLLIAFLSTSVCAAEYALEEVADSDPRFSITHISTQADKTVVTLVVKGGTLYDSAYCLDEPDGKFAYVLKDNATEQLYPLLKKESTLIKCDDGYSAIKANTEVSSTLTFAALPDSVENIAIYEKGAELNQFMSFIYFKNISLPAGKK